MAKIVAVAWFPRSYIHLYETYQGIGKIDLDVSETVYGDDSVSFTISGYENYPKIRFTQGWSGLHYFTTDLPDEGIEETAKKYLVDMQNILVEHILKNCHTVTYKQIIADILTLDFHLLVLTTQAPELPGYTIRDADLLRVAYKPQATYESGNVSYLLGTDDQKYIPVLLYHAYTEIAADFLYNLMKSMIRLYHEADSVFEEINSVTELSHMTKPMKQMDDIVKESSERYGKLRHILLNFKLKEQQYYSQSFDLDEKEICDGLGISHSFKKLEADGAYMSVLWGEILLERLKNIDQTLDARMKLVNVGGKKGWF